jgi:hypothetical protein
MGRLARSACVLAIWSWIVLGASAEPARPIASDAREAASLVARGELAAGRSEGSERRQLKLELVRLQELLFEALGEEVEGGQPNARPIVLAECGRLRRSIPSSGAADPALSGDWARLGGALDELCRKIQEIAAAPPDRRRALASHLLERMKPTVEHRDVAPTIRAPQPPNRRAAHP